MHLRCSGEQQKKITFTALSSLFATLCSNFEPSTLHVTSASPCTARKGVSRVGITSATRSPIRRNCKAIWLLTPVLFSGSFTVLSACDNDKATSEQLQIYFRSITPCFRECLKIRAFQSLLSNRHRKIPFTRRGVRQPTWN